MEEVKILKSCVKSIECIKECMSMEESSKNLNNSQSTNFHQYYQSALVSLRAAQNGMIKQIEEKQDLTKMKSDVFRQSSELESLNDKWKECFAFVVNHITSGENNNIKVSDLPNHTLDSIISMLEDWFIRQKQEVGALLRSTKTAVSDFCTYQKDFQKGRLKKVANQRERISEGNTTNYERVKTSDLETTDSENNQSMECQHYCLRQKYQEAMSLLKNESQLLQIFNIERMNIEKEAEKALNGRLSEVGKTLEVISNDLLFVQNLQNID